MTQTSHIGPRHWWGCLCQVGLEERPGAGAPHSSGLFLLTGSLIASLGQSNSTLVAVSLFLLLTSLTYLLFKLSSRSVAQVSVHV